jgi:ABC-2 type transport system permease protein
MNIQSKNTDELTIPSTNHATAQQTHTPHQVSFSGMVRGELLKITWLRSTWIMLALTVVFTALFTLLNIAYSNVQPLLANDPVLYAYQYELTQNLLIFRALSGFFALVVTAFSFGLEYQQGTIRVLLGRGAGRLNFLFSKIVALFLLSVLVQLGGLLFNALLVAIVTTSVTGSFSAFGMIVSHTLGTFALYSLYMIFNMWVSILLAAAVTVLGRSLAFGLSIALLWFPLDNIAVTLLTVLLNRFFPTDVALKAGNALLGPDLNSLPKVLFPQDINSQLFVPFISIGGWTFAVILAYALVFLVGAALLMHNRDVQQ